MQWDSRFCMRQCKVTAHVTFVRPSLCKRNPWTVAVPKGTRHPQRMQRRENKQPFELFKGVMGS